MLCTVLTNVFLRCFFAYACYSDKIDKIPRIIIIHVTFFNP